MSLSILSSISNHKFYKKANEFTPLTYTFTGTNYTNEGITPFSLNVASRNTTCTVNNLSNNDFTSESGFTFWMRYQLNPSDGFLRLFSFSTVADTPSNKKSFIYVSYNGANYNQYLMVIYINNVYYTGVITPSIINPSNIYNMFFTSITIGTSIYFNYYIYDTDGYKLFEANSNTLLSNINAAPLDAFVLFKDNAFDGRISSGAIHASNKFNKVLSSTELSTYSSMVFPVQWVPLTYSFTGTNFTNSGITPFDLNIGNANTECRITNITSSELIQPSGFSFWFRYKMLPGNFSRSFSFTNLAYAPNSRKSHMFSCYNGTDYNKIIFSSRCNNASFVNVSSNNVVNSNNIYNVFVSTSVVSGNFKTDYYFYDTIGNLLYQNTGSTTLANFNAEPIDAFYLFIDNVYDTRKSAGTIHHCVKFNKVLNNTERASFSAMTV
jgi:hypothetical protein